MTAPLIAANHLAAEPLLRAALAAALPGVTVGGLAEYMTLLDGAPALLPVSVYAIYDGDESATAGSPSPHQEIIRQVWQVAVVAQDMTAAGEALAKVIAALSGVRLAPELKPLKRVPDAHPMMVGNGLFFAFLAFSQPLDMR